MIQMEEDDMASKIQLNSLFDLFFNPNSSQK